MARAVKVVAFGSPAGRIIVVAAVLEMARGGAVEDGFNAAAMGRGEVRRKAARSAVRGASLVRAGCLVETKAQDLPQAMLPGFNFQEKT